MTTHTMRFHPARYLVAWAVHLFTASAACFGLLTLVYIYQHQYIAAFWCMGLAVLIDALDGTFARAVNVKSVLPKMDGALLDNLVDYLNYVITPCFFLFVKGDMLPALWSLPLLIAVIIASSYQFCQSDAKTPDHFFKGFPCYWNITVLYMFLFSTEPSTNALLLALLVILVFVPVKYVYPSRLDYLTNSKVLKAMMHLFSLGYGVCTAMILWMYPHLPKGLLYFSLFYVVVYIALSLYRTFYPLNRGPLCC